MYTPTLAPLDTASLKKYLDKELRTVADAINNPPQYTQAQFESKDSDVNKRSKSEGSPVWDSTTKKPVWPVGSDAAAVWIFGDGTVAYSPQ